MAFSGDRQVFEEIEFDASGSQLAIAQNVTINPLAQSGYPFMGFFSGSSGYSSRFLRTDQSGFLIVRQDEEATFCFIAPSVQIGNAKSMLSMLNTGSNVVKIRRISLINVQTSSVTGVVGAFEFRRMTSHSAGAQISAIDSMDTNDVLPAGITARTGATITGESSTMMFRSTWSTDEWGPGTLDTESHDHSIAQAIPVYQRLDHNTKPITLRTNQGLTIKQVTNSAAGTFDLIVVFSVI